MKTILNILPSILQITFCALVGMTASQHGELRDFLIGVAATLFILRSTRVQ